MTANYAESDQRSISRPQAQRDLLVDLNMQPKDRKLSLKAVDGRSGELVHQAYNTDGDRNKQLLQRMKEVYKENFVTNEPTVGKQKFGDLVADDHSTAMQGIVGKPGGQIDQVFGNLTAKKHSRAFQGQMSAQAFALLFGNLD